MQQVFDLLTLVEETMINVMFIGNIGFTNELIIYLMLLEKVGHSGSSHSLFNKCQTAAYM